MHHLQQACGKDYNNFRSSFGVVGVLVTVLAVYIKKGECQNHLNSVSKHGLLRTREMLTECSMFPISLAGIRCTMYANQRRQVTGVTWLGYGASRTNRMLTKRDSALHCYTILTNLYLTSKYIMALKIN